MQEGEKLPSSVHATAHAYGGTLTLDMDLDALNAHPTFDLTAEIEGANLPAMNDFFVAYGKFDVSQGTFGLDYAIDISSPQEVGREGIFSPEGEE